MELKEIKNYFDLYGYEVVLIDLKAKFHFVSFCKSSIPRLGSMTLPTNRINVLSDTTIEKVIIHKNNKVTIKSNYGYLQFFN